MFPPQIKIALHGSFLNHPRIRGPASSRESQLVGPRAKIGGEYGIDVIGVFVAMASVATHEVDPEQSVIPLS
jgi:hypothetical protein